MPVSNKISAMLHNTGTIRLREHNGKTERTAPALAQCRPDRCPNSCITNRHRPLWAKAIADGEALLKTNRLSPLQREAISDDIKRYRDVVRKL